jgi:hypothetical protein
MFGLSRRSNSTSSIEKRVTEAAERTFKQAYQAALRYSPDAEARDQANIAGFEEAQRVLVRETREEVVRFFVNYAQVVARQGREKPPWPLAFQITAIVFSEVASRLETTYGPDSRVAADAIRSCIPGADSILNAWEAAFAKTPRDARVRNVGSEYADRPGDRVKELAASAAPQWSAEHVEELVAGIALLAPLWKRYEVATLRVTELGAAFQQAIIAALETSP